MDVMEEMVHLGQLVLRELKEREEIPGDHRDQGDWQEQQEHKDPKDQLDHQDPGVGEWPMSGGGKAPVLMKQKLN